MKGSTIRNLNFDIDDHINPWLPPNQVHRFPKPIAWFLGHRESPPKDVGNVLVWFWSFFGGFCAIASIAAIFKYSGALGFAHPPIIIASFGASAVLEYGVIGSPLGQPRNCMFGHFVSALCGICVTKLFRYSDNFEEIKWLAGALSVGLASAMMTFTNTAHPPGGATALLAAIDPDVEGMGWALLPYVLLSTAVMIGIALVVNNIQRQFPMHWWTPRDVGGKLWAVHKTTEPDLEALEEQKVTEAGHNRDAPQDLEAYEEQRYSAANSRAKPVLPVPVNYRMSSSTTFSQDAHDALDRQYSRSIAAGSDSTAVHDSNHREK